MLGACLKEKGNNNKLTTELCQRTCKNLLPLAAHHHSSNTQIYQRWNHFHIDHITEQKKGGKTHLTKIKMQTKIFAQRYEIKKGITLGLRYSWTWKVETGPESILISHN